jgi:hypothetical protein
MVSTSGRDRIGQAGSARPRRERRKGHRQLLRPELRLEVVRAKGVRRNRARRGCARCQEALARRRLWDAAVRAVRARICKLADSRCGAPSCLRSLGAGLAHMHRHDLRVRLEAPCACGADRVAHGARAVRDERRALLDARPAAHAVGGEASCRIPRWRWLGNAKQRLQHVDGRCWWIQGQQRVGARRRRGRILGRHVSGGGRLFSERLLRVSPQRSTASSVLLLGGSFQSRLTIR